MEENIEKTFTEAVQDKARKGKRGVVKLVFGRTAVILLLVALQAAVLVLTSLFLFKYVLYAYAIIFNFNAHKNKRITIFHCHPFI